ncbi:hypothetical protein [Persicobacter diffluens]|uniref:Uncharacterized protein n=1 Tax=Persicobacter diffluens TaxID=981 RepID=A0AAN4W2Y1_9BACT|nr:hypothetical protein PEDI_44710 [Persicobacter diffluens]
MKRILILIMLTCLIFSNCNRRDGEYKTSLLSYFVDISDDEDAGVKDVLGFFGGKCEYSIGMSVLTGEKSKKYFELRLFDSEAIEHFTNNPKFAASNIAYRFYRNLNKEKRNEYTHINPIIVFSDGSEKKFEFSTWELEVVDKRVPFLNKVVDIIRENKYDDLLPLLNDRRVVEYDKNELIENLKKADPQFGNVTDEGFRIFGYKIDALDNKGNDYLYLSGAIIRDIQSNEFSLIIDPYSDKEEIFYMEYKM